MPKINPYLIGTSLLVGLFIGYRYAHNADAAKAAKAERTAEANYERAVEDGEKRVAALMVQNREKDAKYAELKKEIPPVSYVYVHDQQVADPVFPYGFVGVWNAALRGETYDPALSPVDPAARTRVTPDILLDNFVTNTQRCDATTRQLNALIDWHEANDK